MSQRTSFFASLGVQNTAPLNTTNKPSTDATRTTANPPCNTAKRDASTALPAVLEDTTNTPQNQKLNISKIKKNKKASPGGTAKNTVASTTSASARENPQPIVPPTPSRQRSFVTPGSLLQSSSTDQGFGRTSATRRNEENDRDAMIARVNTEGTTTGTSRDSSVATTAYDTTRASTVDSISTASTSDTRSFFQRAPPTPKQLASSSSSRRSSGAHVQAQQQPAPDRSLDSHSHPRRNSTKSSSKSTEVTSIILRPPPSTAAQCSKQTMLSIDADTELAIPMVLAVTDDISHAHSRRRSRATYSGSPVAVDDEWDNGGEMSQGPSPKRAKVERREVVCLNHISPSMPYPVDFCFDFSLRRYLFPVAILIPKNASTIVINLNLGPPIQLSTIRINLTLALVPMPRTRKNISTMTGLNSNINININLSRCL
ncbi:hypothetical protein FRB94_005505 [Tulasnella sp. JGI-2019a]|nr:hypothetical protein FRB94_005505 [Tulasnella sp. JGI-2019a]KAG9038260.1 hypothetical protein FRB95_002221 [Tulasnella sp. JGI-2019a]